MADITVTAANVRLLDAVMADNEYGMAGEAITAGQVVYQKSDGKWWLARANAAATMPAVGIALATVAVGKPLSILRRGKLVGFTLGDPGSPVYVSSATAGALEDTTAPAAQDAVKQCVGRVGAVFGANGSIITKYLYVDVQWGDIYVANP